MSSNKTQSGGIGLSGVLLVIFIVLKLTGLIDWPWVWVLAPLWISIGLFLICLLILFAGYIIDEAKRGY